MVDLPEGKAFTLAMVDHVFRSERPARQASAFRAVLDEFGVPGHLLPAERMLVRSAALISRFLPRLAMSAVAARIRRDSGKVVVPGEKAPLDQYLAERRASGMRVNLNLLGEAILGEGEADRRMAAILEQLKVPAVNYISVKISAIFSQINLLDWDGTLSRIKDRLRRLYRAALPEGKFVNLDMEDYRDLQLTLEAFKQVLVEPEFTLLRAGVVLQAYLPDSWPAQQELTDWARRRVAAGGAPIKLRIVKGANLAMETVEAEMHGWERAPYGTKEQTDANFKRMLEFGCARENASVVNLGVASHNLFDVALAIVLREQSGVRDLVEMEMLEGMANHQARAVRRAAGGLVVYAPAVKRQDFNSAMAYLVRRLDENTAPGNFLRDMFRITPGSPAWERQRDAFLAAWGARHSVSAESRRARSRPPTEGAFFNRADTDWTQAANREALSRALAAYAAMPPPAPGDLDAVLTTARAAQPAWESLGCARRGELLKQCGAVMERQRFDTIAGMVHAAKKAAAEADFEVSEAIDFANYYPQTPLPPAGVISRALGVVVIAPPWNFPYAIPAGGVLAALMAGNAVVLKPAPETVATAWRLVSQLWEAGIPRDVLQFFPCQDGEVGRSLITDPRVDAVVLTGAYETARMFLDWRPRLRLLAETSGKNAIVITAQADRDLAIKDLVKSAFGHAGQKCSAASLAILEAEVYDDPAFRRQLRDAAASLHVGPSTEPASVVTPLIRPPGEALLAALTKLGPGEEWLLEPRQVGDDPCLWSPGIKLGVAPDSWFRRTECFGPVLGVIRADDLDEAIQIQNDSALGLTAGIHSLDDREIARWRDRAQAGNLYINRAITGAIVQRQPFGGWKSSSIGPGAKAGGPNYVNLFLRLTEANEPGIVAGRASDSTELAAQSYGRWWKEYFSRPHDPSGLAAESNVLRYRPCRGVVLRLEQDDERTLDLAGLAAETCGVNLHVSLVSQETDAEFVTRLAALGGQAEFLRTVTPPAAAVLAAAYESGLNWIDAPMLSDGRLELPRWLREQSVSQTLHRYGQMIDGHPSGPRAGPHFSRAALRSDRYKASHPLPYGNKRKARSPYANPLGAR